MQNAARVSECNRIGPNRPNENAVMISGIVFTIFEVILTTNRILNNLIESIFSSCAGS